MSSDIETLTQKIFSAKEITAEVVDAMNSLAALQLEKDVAAANETSKRAIEEAHKIQYTKGEAVALMQAGMGLSKLRKFKEAIEWLERSMAILQTLNDAEAIANVHAKLGTNKLYDGNYPEALDHLSRALEIRTMHGDTLGSADIHTNMGIVHGLMGNNFLALKLHLQALKTYERINETSRIASSSSNIGLIYIEQQNFDEALKMFQHALAIREQSNDQHAIGIALNNIGYAYQEQMKFPEALEAHFRALKIREAIGDRARIATTYSNLGSVYKELKDTTLALNYFMLSLQTFEELKDKRGLIQSYINLGELYFDFSNHDEAYSYLNKAVQLGEEIGLKNQLRKAYEYLSRLYARDEKYKEAYEYHLNYLRLDKEISNAEISGQIAQINMRYEIEQQEKAAEFERVKNTELTRAYNSLEVEKKRSEELLLNILPEEISEELKQSGKTSPRSYKAATVLFADIKSFTKISEQFSAEEIVSGIDEYFEEFDKLMDKHGIEKIKTIGDAYLCVSGVPVPDEQHAEKMVGVAKDFIVVVAALKEKRIKEGKHTFDFRVGVHSGPIVAGVVGIKKFAYDIWGDTVNTASRMQSNSEPNRINISETTYQLVKEKYACVYRGEIEAKNKGKLKMYFVE